EVPRLLQPALALESPGQPPVIGCVVHRAGTLDSADSSTERQPSGTSLALLRHRNGEWAIDGATLGSPAGSSYSSPHPLVGPDGAVSVLFQETQARTRDHLGCWVVDGGAVVPVDDDPSGAPKLGFSALWADGTLHVAYADGRDNPGQGAYLYYTASADPRQGFARSRRLDPPHPRAWQAPPQLAAQGGLLLIGSTALTHRYFPRAYRDKLRRHRVAGLYQALAYSREPVVWWSTDNGASFHRTDGIDDQDIEVSAGAVFALPRDGRVAAVWSESRPVTRPPDLRWATAGGLSHRFTATRAFNPAPGDNSAEVLYDAVWLPDGALAALYKDMTPDGSAGLYLARSEPLE
ncbi:MAG TPA: hypothetical protein VEI97_01860, partial [bacterium]|nr:hypothetical protein [bacterium]